MVRIQTVANFGDAATTLPVVPRSATRTIACHSPIHVLVHLWYVSFHSFIAPCVRVAAAPYDDLCTPNSIEAFVIPTSPGFSGLSSRLGTSYAFLLSSAGIVPSCASVSHFRLVCLAFQPVLRLSVSARFLVLG